MRLNLLEDLKGNNGCKRKRHATKNVEDTNAKPFSKVIRRGKSKADYCTERAVQMQLD